MRSTTQALSADRLFHFVADQRRRAVLRALIEGDETAVSIDELAAEITDDELPPTEEQAAVERTATWLCHVYLPELDDAGVIGFDPRSGAVRYRSHDTVEQALQFVSDTLE